MVKNTETRQVQSVPQACSDDSEIEQTGVGRQVHVLDVFHTGPADRAGLQERRRQGLLDTSAGLDAPGPLLPAVPRLLGQCVDIVFFFFEALDC